MFLSSLTAICIIAFSANAFAHETPKSVNETLKEKIVRFIEKPDMSGLDGQKFQAEIEFIVTRQNRVVVLAIYTNDPFFDEYLKQKLNYRSIHLKGVQKMIPYRLNVSFIQPQS